MTYMQDIAAATHALDCDDNTLNATIETHKAEIEKLAEDLSNGVFPAFSMTTQVDDLMALSKLALNWAKTYTHIVFLGVGGSSLGAQTLVNFMGRYAQRKPEIILLDNVDPSSIQNLLLSLPLETTGVVAVSKSGGTIETLAQTALFIETLKAKNLTIAEHVCGLTEDTDNKLRTYLNHYGTPILNHPQEVGGRFTLFTLVGLIPALLTGMNVVDLRRGAADVLGEFLQNPLVHSATEGAVLSLTAENKGYPMQVMMPYSDKLKTFSNWYVQLWAESLGKEGKGTTPVPAVGSTDQHSFLQLMMEGPNDKLITIIATPEGENELKISETEANLIGDETLSGLSLGKLLYSQAQGTADALISAGKPVRFIQVESLNEESLGALAMHFMLETAITGAMMNVNTWNQPGVEESKIRTLDYLKNNVPTS